MIGRPLVEPDEADRHGFESGWDVEWASMNPEQIVAEMRRVVPALVLAQAFIENEQLWRLWCQWRIESLKGEHDA